MGVKQKQRLLSLQQNAEETRSGFQGNAGARAIAIASLCRDELLVAYEADQRQGKLLE